VKKTLALAFVLAMVLAAAAPAGAASWSGKVNGGSSYATPYGEFTVTLSAFSRTDGTATGQGEYSYPPLNRAFHLEVEGICLSSAGGYPTATAWGPARGQDGTADGYGMLSIRDRGDMADQFRAGYAAGATDASSLQSVIDQQCFGSAIFPATVVDGSFHITSR
jgi:hypothetical protein